MARPFEWATRRSRVGTDRFGTGPVGTGSDYDYDYDYD
jgi:hypothetical protein